MLSVKGTEVRLGSWLARESEPRGVSRVVREKPSELAVLVKPIEDARDSLCHFQVGLPGLRVDLVDAWDLEVVRVGLAGGDRVSVRCEASHYVAVRVPAGERDVVQLVLPHPRIDEHEVVVVSVEMRGPVDRWLDVRRGQLGQPLLDRVDRRPVPTPLHHRD